MSSPNRFRPEGPSSSFPPDPFYGQAELPGTFGASVISGPRRRLQTVLQQGSTLIPNTLSGSPVASSSATILDLQRSRPTPEAPPISVTYSYVPLSPPALRQATDGLDLGSCVWGDPPARLAERVPPSSQTSAFWQRRAEIAMRKGQVSDFIFCAQEGGIVSFDMILASDFKHSATSLVRIATVYHALCVSPAVLNDGRWIALANRALEQGDPDSFARCLRHGASIPFDAVLRLLADDLSALIRLAGVYKNLGRMNVRDWQELAREALQHNDLLCLCMCIRNGGALNAHEILQYPLAESPGSLNQIINAYDSLMAPYSNPAADPLFFRKEMLERSGA